MATKQIAEIIIKTIESRLPKNDVIIATVKTPPPNLSIEFGGQIIPSEMLYCSNYLLNNYMREYKLEGIIDEMQQEVNSYNLNNTTATGESGPGSHTHAIKQLSGKGTIESIGNYKTHGKMWFTDTLKVGGEVLCQRVGNFYVVLDRIIKMPSNAEEGGA
ncbi:MAG: DUF2577 family protein [Fusobacteriaceae bacterium]